MTLPIGPLHKGGSLNAEATPQYWPRSLHDMPARIIHFERWLLACHWVLNVTKILTLVGVNLDLTINKVGRIQ